MSPERVYSEEGGKELLAQHVARYKFAQAFVTNKTVVDFACGSGYGTAMLAKEKPKNVTGIDISQDAVSYAKTHFEIQGVTFLQGSIEVLSGMRAIDIIVSFETIEHLAMYDSFMEIVANVLSPNGILIISTPVRQSGTLFDKPDNPFHLRESYSFRVLHRIVISFDCKVCSVQIGTDLDDSMDDDTSVFRFI